MRINRWAWLGLFVFALGIFQNIQADSAIQVIGKGLTNDSLVHPAGIAIHHNSLLICDAMQSKVFVYDTRTKKLTTSFGAYGDTSMHLREPQGICTDNSGNIYITHRDQVVKFDDQYRFVSSFQAPGILLDIIFYKEMLWFCHYSDNEVLVLDPKNMRLSHRFSTGRGPTSLAFNSGGELLVSESGEHRISFYTEKGARIRNPLILGKNSIIDSLSIGINDWIYLHDSFYYKIYAYSKGGGSKLREIDIPGNTVRCWKPGINGMIARNDLIYFSSITTQEVIVTNDMGVFRESYGKKAEPNELLYPKAIAITQDQLHVVDMYAGNVKRYNMQGHYIGEYGSRAGRGRMDYPSGISLHNQQLYLLNAHSNIFVFDTLGQFQREITVQTPLFCASDLVVFQSAIYIADTGNQRIVKLDMSGKLIQEYKGFAAPSNVWIDPFEKMFIADPGDSSIQIYASGSLMQTLRNPKMKFPSGMVVVDGEVLLVADRLEHLIHIFVQFQDRFVYAKSFGTFGGPKTNDPKPGIYQPDYQDQAGLFAFPEDVKVDDQFIYVIDRLNQRVQRIAKGLVLEGLVPEENDIAVYPQKLDFGRIEAGESANMSLTLRKTGTQDIQGTIQAGQAWIWLSKTSFEGDINVNVSISTLNLSSGEHISEIIVNSNFRKVVVPVTVYIEISDEEPPFDPPSPPEDQQRIIISLQINNPKASINNNEVWIDASNPAVVPVILPPGRTFVPLRFIAEAFGAEVQWDGATRTVRIYLESKDVRITLQIDNVIARVNQEVVSLDAAPQILNGRTFVPLRFIAEAFGAEVQWDGREQRIVISLEL